MSKTILITGSNGNIGFDLAKRFLQKGHNLILIYNQSASRIDSLKSNESVKLVKTDLTDLVQTAEILKPVLSERTPDCLIHTASLRSDDFNSLADSSVERWEKVLITNSLCTFNILKIMLPILRENKPGRVVLFGSNVSRSGLKNGSSYAASKAVISSIAKSVAQEEKDILINVVSPGPAEIDDSHFSQEYREFRKEYYKKQLENIPMKRLARPEDLFGLCSYLVSEQNTYITGEEFFLTGGKH